MIDAMSARVARAMLGWTGQEAAERTGLHRNTIVRLERGLGCTARTVRTLEKLYRDHGVVFREDGSVAPPPSP
jgi:DNA-binding XRE family transcriptional regulator